MFQPTPDKMLSVHWDRPEARVYSQGMRQVATIDVGIGKQYGKPVFTLGDNPRPPLTAFEQH